MEGVRGRRVGSILRRRRALTARELHQKPHGSRVRACGLITMRQRPMTANGTIFLTLEDETGNVNVVVWTSVLDRYRAVLLQGQLLKVKGLVEREKEVIHVVAGFVEDLTAELIRLSTEPEEKGAETPFKSRDFR